MRHLFFAPAAAVLSLLAAGCGPGNDAPIPGAATGPAWAADERPAATAEPLAEPFYPAGEAWAVPVPAARGAVGVREFEFAPDPRGEAERRLSEADRLKSEGRYDAARESYAAALAADPLPARAAYQLACNEALAGDAAAAREAFGVAARLGYADFPTAAVDDELGPLRRDADFPDALRAIRRRYLDRQARDVGVPFFVLPADLTGPDGENPPPPNAGGAAKPPVILLLHGYGDSHENYAREAFAWAELGFAAVAVPGSLPRPGGGFVWPTGEPDGGGTEEDGGGYAAVDRQLRAILATDALAAAADTSRAFLLGFSQGGNVAMTLATRHPEVYAGCVGLSPGGPQAVPGAADLAPDPSAPRPAAFFYGTEERRGPRLAEWREVYGAAGWPVRAETFAGGHQFPPDWEGDGDGNDPRRAEVAAFLLEP